MGLWLTATGIRVDGWDPPHSSSYKTNHVTPPLPCPAAGSLPPFFCCPRKARTRAGRSLQHTTQSPLSSLVSPPPRRHRKNQNTSSGIGARICAAASPLPGGWAAWGGPRAASRRTPTRARGPRRRTSASLPTSRPTARAAGGRYQKLQGCCGAGRAAGCGGSTTCARTSSAATSPRRRTS
jgi:hypothetical protein